MGTHARIENGYISIDTTAWLEQRTGGPLPHLTEELRVWGNDRRHHDEPDSFHWEDAALAWCRYREYSSPDPSDPDAGPTVIGHFGTRLDTELWIARADAREHGPIAIVVVNDEAPVVYANRVTDSADWYDADTVDITCPSGHGWTWRTGRELIDASGSFTTLTVVFGPDLDAPFTACPTCTDHHDGRRQDACGCDRSSWIACPACRSRCDVELPST